MSDEKEKATYGTAVIDSPSSEKGHTHNVLLQTADKAATLVAGFHGEITDAEKDRVKRKIDWHLMPILMALYLIQFTDKTTLGSSSILGLKQDNHLSAAQYNWLGTIFYLAYLVFEWPQNLALQRFPPGKWMAGNIIVWSIVLFCHAACHSFAGLFVCRLLLGIAEGSITAGYLIITSMFYTHEEAARRVGYWFLMNGTAQIVSGFLSWAVYQLDPQAFAPWRLFMIICGFLTLVIGILFWFYVPDSPLTARFLTEDEKVVAIERLSHQSSGVENKTWKREQFIEALTDWKCWGFFLFSSVCQLPNSLTNQNALIIHSFGFTVAQTALLGMVSGGIEIIAIYSSSQLLKRFPNTRSIIGAAYFTFCIISAIMIISLPWSAKGALLAAMYIGQLGGAPSFVLALAWCTSTNTGHTKKTTANAMILIGYCLGNLLAPQMWEAKYAPRYYVPWGVILAAYSTCPIILLIMGYFLRRENQRRERLNLSTEKYYDEHGNSVDSTFLDLTDRQNLDYRYPL